MARGDISNQSEDYRRIEKAIQYIETHYQLQPTLDQMAESVHLSKFHFSRLFKRWVGVTPVQFAQTLTLADTKEKLAESWSLLDVAYEAGLSGPSRLHDLFVGFEAITPGEYKRMGAGLEIQYGFGATPFGECLLAITHRGICHLGFVQHDDRRDALKHLQARWPATKLLEKTTALASMIEQIFSIQSPGTARPFHLYLKGTNFQVNVWKALLSIPRGRTVSYQDVAAYIGSPESCRAVGNAVAINPVGYLIPCHRVIAKNGDTHGYRWGTLRKKAILGFEAATF